MTNSARTGFFIAPVSDPTDAYAAGYDGNQFDTENEALDALSELAEALHTSVDVWTVSEYHA